MNYQNDKMGDNQMNVIIKLKPFLFCLIAPPAVGAIPFLIAPSFFRQYEYYIRPVLHYPLSIFFTLWFGMLLLLGAAAYLVYQSRSRSKQRALKAGGYLLAGVILWGLFVFGLKLPLVGLVLMIASAAFALKFAAESLWINKAAFVLCGIQFLWAVYLATNSFFLWRL